MNNVSWKSILEGVGVAGVIVSLIFVGLQLEQSQDIAIAEQYQMRAIAGAEHLTESLQNERWLELRSKPLRDAFDAGALDEPLATAYEELGDAGLIVAATEFYKVMVVFDNYYFQYQHGFMEEEAWSAFRHRLERTLADELNAHLFRSDYEQWRASYRDLCIQILSELQAPAETE